MHMDYEEELYFKRQRVTDALKRLGGLAVEELDITCLLYTSCWRSPLLMLFLFCWPKIRVYF